MGGKVAASFLQWSAKPIVPGSSSPSQTLASSLPSLSSKRRSCRRESGSLSFDFTPHGLNGSALFGPQSSKLHRSKSCELWDLSRTRKNQSIRRACSARLDSFSDEEFSKKIQELALKFQVSGNEEDENNTINVSEPEVIRDSVDNLEDIHHYTAMNSVDEAKTTLDPLDSPWDEMLDVSSIERRANSVDLPFSLRIIKRKLRWEEGFRETSESAYSSMKTAFSSMVFIIRELQSFTIQMRELLFYEDLRGILQRVQTEMHASFVWLFQQVFSHTPTLMVYVMILLANFTVYSMGTNDAIAAASPPLNSAKTEVIVMESQDGNIKSFDSSSIKTFSPSSSNGEVASIGGNNGGGGKTRPVASGTEDDAWFDGSDRFSSILPHGSSQLSISSFGSTTGESEPSISGRTSSEEELKLWNSIKEEAERMQGLNRNDALDHDVMRRLISPLEVKIQADDYEAYSKTDLAYQTGLAQEPNNTLLLSNYAQFLHLVTHDYDRAETYFKKAIEVQPADAEAYSNYATFLWRVRNDLWRAEENFLEAISADPTNSYYSANYAHFLWNTGGEDTCFPLSSPEPPEEA